MKEPVTYSTSRFANEHDAKEFLVAMIVSEAAREHIALSDTERKMLFFSNADECPQGTEDTVAIFDSEYDSAVYEQKIAGIVRKLRQRLKREDPNALKDWSSALKKLKAGDHYLLVVMQVAAERERPPYDRLKLWLTALLLVAALTGLLFLLPLGTGAGNNP